jgi:hypothetical protein
MKNSKLVVAAFAALSLTAGQALAQEEGGEEGGGEEGMGEPEGGDTTPAPETTAADEGGGEMAGPPPMTVPKGKIDVSVAIGVNLSKDSVAKPFAILPDVFYGVNDKLDVGLGHSAYAIQGWWAEGLGGGLCLAGEDNGCAKVYNGPTGLLAHYSLAQGSVDLAADAGLVFKTVSDPMQLGIKLGVKGRKLSGKLAIGFNPNIYIGATERDGGNKEYLNIPVDLMFMASDKLAAGVQTGIQGPLDGFGDGYSVPLSLGAMFKVNDNISAGGSFNLLRVAGFEGPGAADLRSLTLFFNWHN